MALDKDLEPFLKQLGQRIRQFRLEKGWTLEQTEERGEISWRHLQKIEAGKNFTIGTLLKLSRLFKISPSKLLDL